VCHQEVAFAASLNKRFAPVVFRRADDKSVPNALARLNFIFFDDAARFEASLGRLVEALTTDIGWIRMHTELGEAARRWAAAGQPGGLLLRSPVLEEAEHWIAARPENAPAPTDETQTFIAESRRGATRRRNILTGSLAAGLVVALGLAALAYWQRGVAVTAQTLAERNFNAAKSTVNRVLFDLADGLRDVEGIRAETVRVILGRAEKTIDDLASQTANDPEVRRTQEVMYNQFSDIYLRLGATQLAIDSAQKSLAIARALLAEDPASADWQRDLPVAIERLGDAQLAQGNRAGALAAYREILDIRRSLAAKSPDDPAPQGSLALALRKLGGLEQQTGNQAGALLFYRQSLDIVRALAAKAPDNTRWQRDLTQSLNMVGDVMMAQGDVAGALATFREAVDIGRALAAKDSVNTEWLRDLSLSLDNVGEALRAQGDRPGALAVAREALDIARRLAARDPGNTQWQRDLSLGLNKVGDLLKEGGDLAGALASYREGLDIRRALAAKDPDNALWPLDILASLERIGDVVSAQGDAAAAIGSYREALVIARTYVAKDPGRLRPLLELAYILSRLGPLVEPPEGRTLLTEALTILEKLEQEHKLPAGQKNWPDIVRAALAMLP
jgi:tetratricopeptide (TPR) repeat protein